MDCVLQMGPGGALHVQKVRLLYKTILQLHRGLPVSLQTLGNSYVKDEFKRHKNANPAETAQFMMEWTVSWALMIATKEWIKNFMAQLNPTSGAHDSPRITQNHIIYYIIGP